MRNVSSRKNARLQISTALKIAASANASVPAIDFFQLPRRYLRGMCKLREWAASRH